MPSAAAAYQVVYLGTASNGHRGRKPLLQRTAWTLKWEAGEL